MKKLACEISSEALSDLTEIWHYTWKKWSKEQADHYYSLIVDEIEFIRSNHSISTSAEHIRSGYRVSLVQSHMIFHKLTDDGILEIIRILHQSVNIEEWL